MVDHIFIACPLITTVWFSSHWNFRLETYKKWTMRDWFGKILNTNNDFPLDPLVAIMITWMMRIQMINRKVIPDPEEICGLILRKSKDYW